MGYVQGLCSPLFVESIHSKWGELDWCGVFDFCLEKKDMWLLKNILEANLSRLYSSLVPQRLEAWVDTALHTAQCPALVSFLVTKDLYRLTPDQMGVMLGKRDFQSVVNEAFSHGGVADLKDADSNFPFFCV